MNRTSIEWTHWSVNAFKMRMPDGTLINVCIHKSEGCRFCYAEGIVRRWWKKDWGEFPGYTAALLRIGTPVLVEAELQAVLRLSERIAKGKADPQINRVFWHDMTDEYLEFWPDEFLDQVWAARGQTPNLIHQVLTKRPERMARYFSDPYHMNRARTWALTIDGDNARRKAAPSWPLPNVWLGVSVEDQKTADERIPLLLQTPAALRWISAEPLLGRIDLTRVEFCKDTRQSVLTPTYMGLPTRQAAKVDWVVVGGESGPRARPFDLAWARSLVSQCRAASVPVFVKQLGAKAQDGAWTLRGHDHPTEPKYLRPKDKKGGDINEWPEDLRIREFPKAA